MRIFDWQANKGIIDQVSGTALTNSGMTIKNTDKGLAGYFNLSSNLNSTGYNPGSSSFSISVGFKATSTGSFQTLVGKRNGSLATEIGYSIILVNNGGVRCYIGDGTVGFDANLSTTKNLTDGKWHYVVMIVDRILGNRYVYIDGILSDTTNISTMIGSITNANLSYIGIMGAVLPVRGHITGVKIYNTTLSQQEIINEYKQFLSLTPIQPPKRNIIYPKPEFLIGGIGVNLVPEASSTFDTDGTAYWTVIGGARSWDSINKWMTFTDNGTAGGPGFNRAFANGLYKVTFRAKSNTVNTIKMISIGQNSIINSTISNPNFTSSWQDYSFLGKIEDSILRLYWGATNTGETVDIDDISVIPMNSLVGAWNMKKVGKKVYDISGNWRDGTISGRVYPDKEGLSFFGTGLMALPNGTLPTSGAFSINCSFIPTSISFNNMSLWGSGSTTNYMRMDLAILKYRYKNGAFDVNVATGILVGKKYNLTVNFDGSVCTIYLNGVLTNTINDPAVANSNTFQAIGNAYNGFGGYCTIMDFRVFNKSQSLQEIKDYHNQFAKRLYLRDNFDFEDASGNNTVPRGWMAGTGKYKIVTETTGNSIINKGQNYLECTTAGTIAIPCNQAYGTWEFSVYSNSITTTTTVWFVNGKTAIFDGYFLEISGSGIIRLRSNSAGNLFLTASSYSAKSLWYRMRITRTTAGVFTIYIKGGAFTDWTLISTVGGSGTNPATNTFYSTSNFFVLDLDVGDRFAGLEAKEGIEV